MIKLTTHLSRRLLIFRGSADSNLSFLTPRWILSKSVNVCPWSVSNSASSFFPGWSLTSLNLVWIETHFVRSCSSSLINLRYTEPLGVLLSSLHVDSTEFNSDWFRENSSSKACCCGITWVSFDGHLLTNEMCGLQWRTKICSVLFLLLSCFIFFKFICLFFVVVVVSLVVSLFVYFLIVKPWSACAIFKMHGEAKSYCFNVSCVLECVFHYLK